MGFSVRYLHYCAIALALAVTMTGANAGAPDPSLGLSDSELAWLAEHPVIRFSPDPDYAPIEWINLQGDYNGVSSDFVRLLEQRLGVEFVLVRGDNWYDTLQQIKTGEIDALSAIIRTEQRAEYMAFTEPYFRLKRAIFSTQNLDDIKTLDDLQGYKVAVVKGTWMDEKLSQQPGISLNRFQDLTTALLATSRGVTDVTGNAYATITFLRHREGLLDLKLITELPNDIQLSFGVRKDWAPLAGILSTALQSITAAEEAAIRAKWLKIDEPSFWERPIYRYTALALITTLLTAMVVVVAWNRTLNARVLKRSRQLESAQMQLIQAEKMESIGRLSAGIAHEVKNPLAIIQMCADYLTDTVDSDPTTREVISDIDDAVRRADTVIKGLLDFSRDDKLELKSTDCRAVVEEAVRLVAHETRLRNIEIDTQLPATQLILDMDVNKIQQVLINLIMNSVHAINRDGNITVTAAPQSIVDSGTKGIKLQIIDSGPGISDADLKKLFDPFFTTKPVGEGTGLGLSVSQKIIELHNGTLDICNSPAGGAMVTILFSLNTED